MFVDLSKTMIVELLSWYCRRNSDKSGSTSERAWFFLGIPLTCSKRLSFFSSTTSKSRTEERRKGSRHGHLLARTRTWPVRRARYFSKPGKALTRSGPETWPDPGQTKLAPTCSGKRPDPDSVGAPEERIKCLSSTKNILLAFHKGTQDERWEGIWPSMKVIERIASRIICYGFDRTESNEASPRIKEIAISLYPTRHSRR